MTHYDVKLDDMYFVEVKLKDLINVLNKGLNIGMITTITWEISIEEYYHLVNV